MERFFTIETGNTLGTHKVFIERLVREGAIQVTSAAESDVVILFCPIVSRAGTDIAAAESMIPEGKPIIFVVMHHTFDEKMIVAEGSRLVRNEAVILTVDCLFHDSVGFLNCSRNESAVASILKMVTPPKDQKSMFSSLRNPPGIISDMSLLSRQEVPHARVDDIDNIIECLKNGMQQMKEDGRKDTLLKQCLEKLNKLKAGIADDNYRSQEVFYRNQEKIRQLKEENENKEKNLRRVDELYTKNYDELKLYKQTINLKNTAHEYKVQLEELQKTVQSDHIAEVKQLEGVIQRQEEEIKRLHQTLAAGQQDMMRAFQNLGDRIVAELRGNYHRAEVTRPGDLIQRQEEMNQTLATEGGAFGCLGPGTDTTLPQHLTNTQAKDCLDPSQQGINPEPSYKINPTQLGCSPGQHALPQEPPEEKERRPFQE